MTPTHLDVIRALKKLQDKKRASVYMRFFKTGKNEYGRGDQFFGITVPKQRIVAQVFVHLPLSELGKLITHPKHECRLTGLLIAVMQYKKADEKKKKQIYTWYIKNAKRVNNWDLVDSSASYIVGAYLFAQKNNEWKKILMSLAKSDNLWERRIAIVSTYYFIRQGVFDPTITVATQLLSDTHDLIHKAVGWMLREVGKKDEKILRDFLDIHAKEMPRTMLRYAIEKMSVSQRRSYMIKK